MISYFIVGFLKIKTFKNIKPETYTTTEIMLSVIIPVRNEADNLISVILSLKAQLLEQKYFEVIFVNDNSTDSSLDIINKEIKGKKNFKIINLKKHEQGKKQAIKRGIEVSQGNYIVTSDADCTYNVAWLLTIFNYLQNKNPDMLIAPVEMTANSFFQKLQALEFSSLIGSTIGAVGIGRPIMCNGANLIYKKKIYQKINDALNIKEASGDDIFLLHAVKKNKDMQIRFLKSKKAIVKTSAESSLKAFVNQRIRWSSKSKSYKDIDTIIVALLVLAINLATTFVIIFTIFDVTTVHALIIFLSLKVIPDFLLLFLTTKFFNRLKLMILLPVVNLFYFLYIILIGVAGIVNLKIVWKKRNY